MATFPYGPDGGVTHLSDAGSCPVYLDRGDDLGQIVDQVRAAGDTLGLGPGELAISLVNEGRISVTIIPSAADDGSAVAPPSDV